VERAIDVLQRMLIRQQKDIMKVDEYYNEVSGWGLLEKIKTKNDALLYMTHDSKLVRNKCKEILHDK